MRRHLMKHCKRNLRLAGWCLGALLLGFTGAIRGGLIVGIGQNFTASTYLRDSSAVPPDSNGTVGPQHFVEFINGRFAVFNKANGIRVLNLSDFTFWSRAGVTVPNNFEVTDPRLVYDPTVQRWFASMLDFDPNGILPNRFLLAVSSGADPTGPWQGLAFAVDPAGGNVGDFDTLGVDANGVYLSADLFDTNSNALGPTLVSIPKADLLAQPPTAARRTEFGMLSYSVQGNILQPAVNLGSATGGEAVLAVGDVGTDFLPHTDLKTFAVLNAAGPSATLTTPTDITVAPYTAPYNPPQPDGSNNLDDGDARFSATVYQFNGVLYAVHCIQAGARAALRWYQISAASHAVLQSGTITDPTLDLFYPSIAVNTNGTMVIGCNGSSSNSYVSAYAVVGETVNGVTTFGSLLLLKAGTASYQNTDTSGTSRWGDYSATSVDPADPTHFWTIQAFPSAPGAWSTQITELVIGAPSLTLTSAGAAVVISWPASATGFQLQTAEDPGPAGVWSAVPQTPVASGSQISVQIPISGGPQFFRLSKTIP